MSKILTYTKNALSDTFFIILAFFVAYLIKVLYLIIT